MTGVSRMDIRRMLRSAAWVLVFATAGAWANIADDVANGEPLDTILTNATDAGMTVKDAVAAILGLSPDSAYETITAAICLIPNFKPSACTVDGEQLDTKDCADSVTAAAGASGVDSGTIARAAAAGQTCWINRVNPSGDEWGGGGAIPRTRVPVFPASNS